MLEGKLPTGTSKTKKIQIYLDEVALFWMSQWAACPPACTMWPLAAKGLLARSHSPYIFIKMPNDPTISFDMLQNVFWSCWTCKPEICVRSKPFWWGKNCFCIVLQSVQHSSKTVNKIWLINAYQHSLETIGEKNNWTHNLLLGKFDRYSLHKASLV